MSCGFGSASSSSLSNSLFEEDWKMCGGDDIGDLGPIAEFNANFDLNNGQSGGGCIDPQLLSNASSPAGDFSPLFNDNDNGLPDNTTIDANPNVSQDDIAMFNNNDSSFLTGQANTGATTTNYPSPMDFTQSSAAPTPYFHTIEMQNTTMQQQQSIYVPSPLRQQLHRRSVSEPPGGLPDHQLPYQAFPSGAAITFHRGGTPLDRSQQHPNQRLGIVARSKHPNRQQPYPVAKRDQLRRAQTQPTGAPTSVPMMQHMPPPQMMMMQPAMPRQQQFVSSRVCTPQPSPPQERVLESPFQLDPRLSLPATGSGRKERVVAIPVTVEQLGAMITKAVQDALEKSAANAAGVRFPKEEGLSGDTDRVVETTEGEG